MTQKHTPEPWALTAEGLGFSVRSAGTKENGYSSEHICSMDHYRDDRTGFQVPNARRAVAAVNACEGIPTDALDDGVVADMLEALRALMDLNDNGGPFGGEIYQDRVDRAWNTARAAIAKAEGRS